MAFGGELSRMSEDQWSDLYSKHLKTLQQNTSAMMEKLGMDRLLIHSGRPGNTFLDDETYPFKVNPHFNYWLPLFNHQDCFLYLQLNCRPILFYYRPQSFWFKVPDAPQGFYVKHFDIVEVAHIDEVKKALMKDLSKTYYIGYEFEKYASWGLNNGVKDDYILETHFMRTQKSEYEVACIHQANRRGLKGHRAAEEAFRRGASELEIHCAYMLAVESTDNEQPYNNIIALNHHGAYLHYEEKSPKRYGRESLKSLLVDAGSTCYGYASDITRSYCFNNEGEFAELLQGMEELQLSIISKELRLGRTYVEVHEVAHHLIAQLLLKTGICSGTSDESLVNEKVTKVFFPHGLGHYLGIQVHDVGAFSKDKDGLKILPPKDHPYLRMTDEIRAQHVFTIEPGIYFIDFLLQELKQKPMGKFVDWQKVERLKAFGGIRIEDNIVAHANNTFTNLTRS